MEQPAKHSHACNAAHTRHREAYAYRIKMAEVKNTDRIGYQAAVRLERAERAGKDHASEWCPSPTHRPAILA